MNINILIIRTDYKLEQTQLFEIALNNELEWGKRYNAIKKIEDPILIEKIVLNSNDPDIRNIAAEKVEDEKLLINIVLNDEDYNVRKTAIGNLASWNRDIFKKIARNDPNWIMRREAIERLPAIYDEFFANIMITETDYRVRKASMRKIKMVNLPTDTLMELSLKSHDSEVRAAAARMINEEDLLCKIAIESGDYVIAEEAMERIKSNGYFKIIAKKAGFAHTRMFATKLIEDQEFIREIIQTDESMLVRGVAIHCIDSIEILETIKMMDNIDLISDIEERITILKNN